MLPRQLVLPITAVALFAAPIATAFAMQDSTKDAATGATTPYSVLAMNQKAEGNTVTIAYANLPQDGYVAIYGSDGEGKRSGEPLGFTPLAKGDHRNIAVKLSSAPKAGASLWASLYKDVDGDKKLDAKTDQPVWKELPLENRFEVNG